MRFYALATRPWIEDPDTGGHWGLPPGTIGTVDLAPVGGQSYVFVTSDQPFDAADIEVAIGDGTRLDSYVPTADEAEAWERLVGAVYQSGWTLLDLLWSTLTDQADPDGTSGPKPLMPTHRGVLELHLGGHSLVRSERLPEDPTLHPAWSNIQRVLQNSYRQHAMRDLSLARKWLGAQQRKYRLSAERVRDLIIPDDLPRVLPLPPTTTIGDDFTDTDTTALSAHTASGPNAWAGSWLIGAGASGVQIVSNAVTDLGSGADTMYEADANLSSDDHYSQIDFLTQDGDGGGRVGLSVRSAVVDGSISANGYMAWQRGPGDVRIRKKVSGTDSDLATGSAAFSLPHTYKLEIDGTTLRFLQDGSEILSVTDTTFSGQVRAGIAGEGPGDGDNFEAADLVAGQTVAIGIAAETDSALAFTAAKAKAVGLAAETDAGLAVTATKARPVGLAAETDAALAAGAAKAKAINQASELGAALAATAHKSKAIGQASEADAARPFSAQVGTAIGIASETDSALSLASAKAKAVGLAAEADTALAAGAAKARAVGLASEIDLARAVAAAKAKAIGRAAETDAALGLGRAKAKAIGLAAEADTALPFSLVTGTVIGLALEIDSALAFGRAKARAIGLALEADTALAFTLAVVAAAAPAARTVTVAAELRRLTVAAETRTMRA